MIMSQKQYACFSAAIKAETGRQAFGRLDTGTSTCAIGGALKALGISYKNASCCEEWASPMVALYPYMGKGSHGCPACGEISEEACLWGIVIHLNDIHRWTREAVADWLYAEEEKLGFVTLTEETKALKPEMIAESNSLNTTVSLALVSKK